MAICLVNENPSHGFPAGIMPFAQAPLAAAGRGILIPLLCKYHFFFKLPNLGAPAGSTAPRASASNDASLEAD